MDEKQKQAFKETALKMLRHEPWEADFLANPHTAILKENGGNMPPLYSEACLYPLFGKEEARTIRAYLRNLFKAAGFELHELEEEAFKEE